MLDLNDLFELKARHAGASSSFGASIANADKYRSTRVRDTIDPTDGKTKTCNRACTFDTFVHKQYLGEDEPQKPARHAQQVTRAIAKLKRRFKRPSSKAKK